MFDLTWIDFNFSSSEFSFTGVTFYFFAQSSPQAAQQRVFTFIVKSVLLHIHDGPDEGSTPDRIEKNKANL